ncbi:hypothetical protein Tco_0998950 [Tanacetum coccineum]
MFRGTPVISAGFQAKISKFRLSKEHSSLRPFSVNVDPMAKFCSGDDSGPEIIAHSIGMTLLLCSVTVPPSTGNFNIPCAVDGTARIFLMPGLPIIALCWGTVDLDKPLKFHPCEGFECTSCLFFCKAIWPSGNCLSTVSISCMHSVCAVSRAQKILLESFGEKVRIYPAYDPIFVYSEAFTRKFPLVPSEGPGLTDWIFAAYKG